VSAVSASAPTTSPRAGVTDHRIGLTLYKIDPIVDGDLDEIIEALITAHQVEQLKEMAEVETWLKQYTIWRID